MIGWAGDLKRVEPVKTTIKLTASKRLEIQPCKRTGGVLVELVEGLVYKSSEAIHLTADQVGAMIVGLEMAARRAQGEGTEKAAVIGLGMVSA